MREEELKNILLQSGVLTLEDLKKVGQETKKLKRSLEQVLLDTHLLTKDILYKTIAQKIGIEYKDLSKLEVSPDLLNIYSQDLARDTHSAPLFIKNGFLHIAMEDPQNISFIDQIQASTGYPLEVYFSPLLDITEATSRIYRTKDEDLFSELKVDEVRRLSETPSISKIVDVIITQGVRDRASDIHIEPEEGLTRVRFRIDGVLHEIPPPPKDWELAVISRIKVLAGMNIAESRLPQDGHFRIKVDDKVVDFRVSTLRTIHGENLVMRVLDTASVTIGLERMGFTTPYDLKRYEELISRPYGIVLSTGPTGCGKTTTLHSALMRINTVDRNIITLEDPVEYRLGLIRQVQVDPKAGMTFSVGLRSIFRQDPDVIMIGEIRDLETARMAIQAALTGHLVFSTLHTNDAPSAVARLIDMGIDPFLVSASLSGVMAQRLVRVICSNCKEPHKPTQAVIKRWGLEDKTPPLKVSGGSIPVDKSDLVVYRGKGCEKCRGTGFYGRTGIFELMIVDEEIKEMITLGISTGDLRKKATDKGMRLLWEDGREKVLSGITTFEEIARVCEEKIELKGKLRVEEASVISKTPPSKVSGGSTCARLCPQGYEGIPMDKPVSEIKANVSKPAIKVKVDTKDLEKYHLRLARWLSEKK
ncbi:MAG: GspE/PulE family protein [Candidatus Omnitrophica bacterium]|nr:GspE/PulE family protein [Candidatus Omnitrophota bacterium]MBU0878997.1 GspE/PulE family protein [Candidatus Omnitrophota bacterium]MBU0896532.1 GspE/PulE family protein [Candidatus Omnitrophota bacterium]MBU1133968.1 GspE/PulE family protein [Candidatus Omnitrophota bacterium]MBU1366476.1 GspE/PulE family protein [Candidatus Omnitrophota bacterium]